MCPARYAAIQILYTGILKYMHVLEYEPNTTYRTTKSSCNVGGWFISDCFTNNRKIHPI